MKVKILFLFLPLILFNSCDWITDNPQAKNFLLGDTVTVAFDQTIINEDENISLRFSSLVSDGRCPLDLECFWEGNAEVKFVFSVNETKSIFSLNTFRGYAQDTTIAGYRIGLIDLKPYPHSKRTYIPALYRAYVVVFSLPYF